MNPLQSKRTRLTTRTAQVVMTGALLLGASTLGGCDNARSGLFSGAAIGALAGLGLGSLSGNAGEGAAAGAILGGVGGALVGDQNERDRENSRYRGSDH
ncbi:MAG: glycine zipper domain-containing protein, partial [Phycisphaerales bacterium]|nr:glycine zipper domain-containing protein [Phycisphaerales bacterium]